MSRLMSKRGNWLMRCSDHVRSRWWALLAPNSHKVGMIVGALPIVASPLFGSTGLYAYFFYVIEALIAAGQADGLTYEFAYQLAVQTCAGAAKLLTETGQRPEDLRAQVTSPNGTTQRAMETLDAADTKAAWIKAVRAATQRSRELGEEHSKAVLEAYP